MSPGDDEEERIYYGGASSLSDAEHEKLRIHFAGLAMQAMLTAAWTNSYPTMEAYTKSKGNKAPGNELRFDDWLCQTACTVADRMMIAIERDSLDGNAQ